MDPRFSDFDYKIAKLEDDNTESNMETKTNTQNVSEEIPSGKVKKYIHLAKKNPIQAYLDIINVGLVLILLFSVVAIIISIVGVFHGNERPKEIFFNLGTWQIYWNGVFIALGILLGVLITLKQFKKKNFNFDTEEKFTSIFFTIVFALIFARFANIFSNPDAFFAKMEFFNTKLSLFGGLIGGFLFLIYYAWHKKVSLGKLLDIFSPGLLFGIFLGKLGLFFNQGYFGIPSDFILKSYVSPEYRPIEYKLNSYFHPLYIYEAILVLILLISISTVNKRKNMSPGSLFSLSIFFYSLIKFALGFLEINQRLILNLDLTQIIAIIFAITSLLIYFLIKRRENINK